MFICASLKKLDMW